MVIFLFSSFCNTFSSIEECTKHNIKSQLSNFIKKLYIVLIFICFIVLYDKIMKNVTIIKIFFEKKYNILFLILIALFLRLLKAL